MTAEQKTAYKKSVAKMMFFWIINTRRNWRETVIFDQPNAWYSLSLTTEFRNTNETLNGEWMDFFRNARAIVTMDQVKHSLEAINAIAEGNWVDFEYDCPPDPTLNTMYNETAEYIDNLPSS